MTNTICGIAGAVVAVLTLAACQSSTETYGGRERTAVEPPQEHTKQAVAATKERADPEMAAVLREYQELDPKPLTSLSAEEARRQPTVAQAVKEVLKEQDKSTDPQPIARIENRTIPGPGGPIPVRIYTPSGYGPFPVIVYYHGGGWVIATVDTYDASARALANATNAIVMSVEYRKAPEHRFPAAHEDAYAAYKWALRNAQEIDGDPRLVAVAGESAGGNLAAGVSLMARQRRLPLPVHQVLIYPVTGYDFSTPSYEENADARPLNKAMMQWFFEKYLQSPSDAGDPRISLVEADPAGLPPTTVITAGIDPLRSDGRRYAERLRRAGVPVTYRNFEGVTHEFFGMGAVVPDARQAVQLAAKDLNQSFDEVEQPLRSSSASGYRRE
ncbi:alpha/beta hydrolase [Nitrospira moscoviensis]|uniref:Carboxylesterase NlhH n=1 Tax=Nitrospira moscoviensis TaxID=42253 RepID=A0A0K2GF57_NITMO|nr:alpha/beta hydrolase [Nitrospira moscoviensis]ALA59242.1 Carboxylesterase NlhH [Nitrospira moscoviensis]